MKIPEKVLRVIAEMICGNVPYNEYMPYRSSSDLTAFFHDLGHDWRHQGETRVRWVFDRLQSVQTDDLSSSFPSDQLKTIIEHLFTPFNFVSSHQNLDQDKAVHELNKFLVLCKLRVDLLGLERTPVLVSTIETFVSTATTRGNIEHVLTFSPGVFQYPQRKYEPGLVGILMPFDAKFANVSKAIKAAIEEVGLRAQRADDIWNDSVIVQDVWEMIYSSQFIISDFTDKNPNVFYETGIAHTLGKVVIPITQNIEHVPFDLRHHRCLEYLSNGEGLMRLKTDLGKRLEHLAR